MPTQPPISGRSHATAPRTPNPAHCLPLDHDQLQSPQADHTPNRWLLPHRRRHALLRPRHARHGKRNPPPRPPPHPNLTNPPSPRQILFLIGLTIIIGPQKTLVFFARKQKLKGTAAFFAGLALILFKWPLIGFLVELYGIMVLFGDFLGTIAGFARNVPVVGPYIGMAIDRSGLGMRNSELPV